MLPPVEITQHITVPQQFQEIADAFYQGSYTPGSTEQEWIASRLKILPAERKAAAKQFLNKLLNGAYTDAQLQSVWSSTSPDYCFKDAGLRVFLTMIRDAID